MPSPPKRRPLPALVFLLALTLLAALVWWRVLARSTGHASATPSCGSSTGAPAPRELPEQAAITVQVLNSTKRHGIAGAAQRVLVRDGFNAPAPAANDGKGFPGYSGVVKGVAEIRSGPNAIDGATLVQYYFPGAKLVQTNEKDSTVLVSLGLKYKRVATQRQVTAKLRADGIKLVPVVGTTGGLDTGCASTAATSPATGTAGGPTGAAGGSGTPGSTPTH